MSIAGLTSTEQTTAIKAVFVANDVRALIANHLGISISRVTDEAHFTIDLGADWLDRLDLMMAVEDRFAGLVGHDIARRERTSVPDAIHDITNRHIVAAGTPGVARPAPPSPTP